MRRLALFAVLLIPLLAVGELQAACQLVPVPKVYREKGRMVRLLGPESVAIVVGAKAAEPERYAARQLQTLIERRFRRRLPIIGENDVAAGVRQVLLLGQRGTNAWLDRLCRESKIELGAASPGEDGFVIELLDDGPRQVVLVGGCNAPGVIYGQNALFDLLRRNGDAVELPAVSIRDWPSIRWRGRAHWRLCVHLAPGAMDSYSRYRLNFTDLRDAPTPDGYAAMGFPPGFKIRVPVTKRVLDEAHRRGMFVYGTVSCGVKSSQYDAAIKTFQELIALGVDGIWISLDDVGSGDDAPVILRRALELGREHGMTGRRVANTQPAGDYNKIDTPFNHQAAAIADYAASQWFFTIPPSKTTAHDARRLGLKLKPAWWHNLFNMPGGFLHNANAIQSLRADGKPAYLDMQPLSMGWGSPRYEQLRDAADNTDTVMLWALYDGWPEEYEVGAMGIWAWNPAAHDWIATRKAVYGDVYGPSAAAAALAFDDKLASLKSLFDMPVRHYQPNKGWPPRLKRLADRPKALALLDELEPLARAIRATAARETVLDPARLESVYLEPMQATLRYARQMTLLEYPEYSTGADLAERIYALCDEGKTAQAERLEKEIRPKIQQQLVKVSEELRGLKGVEEYVAFWNKQVGGTEPWARRAAQRRLDMQKAFEALVKTGFSRCLVDQRLDDSGYAAWLERLSAPPAGRLLAEAASGQWLASLSRWRGTWCMGPLVVRQSPIDALGGTGRLSASAGTTDRTGWQAARATRQSRIDGALDWRQRPLAVLAYPRHAPSKPGDYAELRLETPVPKTTGRLRLDLFVNDTKIDPKYPGYRFQELWVNGRVVWQEDISRSREGNEWISVDVTAAAKAAPTLSIRFRAIDRRGVASFGSVTFLGPVRLCSPGP